MRRPSGKPSPHDWRARAARRRDARRSRLQLDALAFIEGRAALGGGLWGFAAGAIAEGLWPTSGFVGWKVTFYRPPSEFGLGAFVIGLAVAGLATALTIGLARTIRRGTIAQARALKHALIAGGIGWALGLWLGLALRLY